MASALYIDEDGVRWDPYVITYERTPDEKVSIEVFARSFEDAEDQLALIAATGEVDGQKRVVDFSEEEEAPPPTYEWT